jgi:formylglycine-generating enzyme required for sulfatase activity
VTNVLYNVCVDAGSCTPPTRTKSVTRFSYYGDSRYGNYPVNNVDWDQAKAYCEWRGASLPNEAQWEKAARGTDGRTYPWGEEISCDQANFIADKRCVGDTTEVGSYESGKSPYGMYDMAGNVFEWVMDWYDESYYANSPSSNPLGPSVGQDHVLRSGSWNSAEFGVRSAGRFYLIFEFTYYSDAIGFRCAKDVNP